MVNPFLFSSLSLLLLLLPSLLSIRLLKFPFSFFARWPLSLLPLRLLSPMVAVDVIF